MLITFAYNECINSKFNRNRDFCIEKHSRSNLRHTYVSKSNSILIVTVVKTDNCTLHTMICLCNFQSRVLLMTKEERERYQITKQCTF